MASIISRIQTQICAFLLTPVFAGCVCQSRVITPADWRVVRVIDGDTFVVHYDGDDTSVRIVGINTPEHGRPGFDAATDDLKALVSGKVVTLTFTQKRKRDSFGRLLADVHVDGVDVTDRMLELGWPKYHKRRR